MLCEIGFVVGGLSNESTSGIIGIITSRPGYVTVEWQIYAQRGDKILIQHFSIIELGAEKEN